MIRRRKSRKRKKPRADNHANANGDKVCGGECSLESMCAGLVGFVDELGKGFDVEHRMIYRKNGKRGFIEVISRNRKRQNTTKRRDIANLLSAGIGVFQKYPFFLRSSIAASETRSSMRVSPRSLVREAIISRMMSSSVVALDSTAAVQVMSPTVR